LSAIRGDFGIDAAADLQTELKARIDANVEGGVTVRSEPARCAVDAKVALEAQAKCDATVDPGKVSMMCDGHCDVESNVDVDCGADAELHCTYSPPTGVCSGSCTGSCEVQVSAAAQCSGMCTGSCTGACSAYSDEAGTQCAGRCEGMCVGSCKIEMMTEASCSGSCTGECTVTAPTTKCESAIRAHCDAKATGMVACKGRCEGHCVPPKAKAECEASARAETKLNVECTPPRIVLDYTLKANADAEAQARFVAAIENLRVSLPSLFASFEQASSVSAAGVDLVSDAKVAVKGGVNAAGKAVVKGDLRTVFGLACAARELDNVGTAVKDSSDHLDKSIHDCTGVKSAIGAM
jgi:modification target Cys-rich repeat protein